MANILIIDDEASIGWGLSELSKRLGHDAVTASSAESGIEEASKTAPDLIFLDVRLPGIDGLTAMKQLQELCPSTPIIVMTAFGELSTAVSAVQQGAFEYLIKPFKTQDIEGLIRRALMVDDSRDRDGAGNNAAESGVGGLVGSSQTMQEAFKRIALAASTDAPILISGESGTGKELAARAIHENSSRCEAPFVTVNIASLSETVAESELFGHVRGAYTGASESRVGFLVQANGGTLFLDEIADIPLTLQVKLLRALENGEVIPVGSSDAVTTNFRIIAATHQSLLDRVHEQRFRHDLYFRLAAYEIHMPPLRTRADDIKLLSEHFLASIATREQTHPARLSLSAAKELATRNWPGNVRELRNAMEHAFIVSRGQIIDPEHLPASVAMQSSADNTNDTHDQALEELVANWADEMLSQGDTTQLYDDLMKRIEPPLFLRALAAHNGQFLAAAKSLGMHRTTLRKKVDDYGLEPGIEG